MKLALGCDHGGYELMQEVKAHLDELGIEFEDFGTYSTESCNYPVYAKAAAEAVASGKCEMGVVICGTGIGVSMCANKVKGIRCALCSDCFSAEMTRRHNDANMLAMGARVLGPGLALRILDTFLNSEFDGGRHVERIKMMMDLENEI